MTYLFLHPIMHLLLFLSPDWLTFCHVIISHINSLGSLFIFCFSLTKGQCSKRQTILSVLAVHRPFYISNCISTLPTQHTTFILYYYWFGFVARKWISKTDECECECKQFSLFSETKTFARNLNTPQFHYKENYFFMSSYNQHPICMTHCFPIGLR